MTPPCAALYCVYARPITFQCVQTPLERPKVLKWNKTQAKLKDHTSAVFSVLNTNLKNTHFYLCFELRIISAKL